MTGPMFTGDRMFLSNFDTTPFYCSLIDGQNILGELLMGIRLL